MIQRLTRWLAILSFIFLIALLAFRFQETRQLNGTVRDLETNLPVPAAVISAAGQIASTDPGGEYSMLVPRGILTVTADSDGYAPIHTNIDASDLLRREITADFALAANRITGVARDAETNQLLTNLQILVAGRTIQTDAAGRFELRAVRHGTPVLVRASGYQPTTVFFHGQPMFNLVLLPNAVHVVVNDQYTGKPVQAQIQLGDRTLATDAEGRLSLRRVLADTVIRASAPGYDSAATNFAGNVTSSTFNLQFAIRPNTLAGLITDAVTKQPLSNASLITGAAVTATNAQGEYRLEDVPANVSLTILAPGYSRAQIEVSRTTRRDVKLTPFAAKAIHVPFGVTPSQWRDLLGLTARTELNALVLTVKSERGYVAWDSQVPLARQIGAVTMSGISLSEIVKACRERKIYCIARVPVFQDTLLAESRPQFAIRHFNGVIYSESGSAWTNAFNQEVWGYIIALAKEIAALGFDEIQWDYVRFPGRVGNIYLGPDNTEEGRVNAVRGFLARTQRELRPSGIFLSADVFGLTVATDDEQQLGQRLRDLGPYLDYISPMVYPDTWGESRDLLRSLGVTNCTVANRCPYDVVYQSYKRAVERTNTKVRLWLQAYPGNGNFGVAEYRAQKRAAEEAGSVGWMFWNQQGNYDARIFGPAQ